MVNAVLDILFKGTFLLLFFYQKRLFRIQVGYAAYYGVTLNLDMKTINVYQVILRKYFKWAISIQMDKKCYNN